MATDPFTFALFAYALLFAIGLTTAGLIKLIQMGIGLGERAAKKGSDVA